MTEENPESNPIKTVSIWLIFGLIFITIAPILFTQSTFWTKFDFSNTSSIGETIGGITSPFVGILEAVLLYYALIEQVKANKIVQEQFRQQNLKEGLQNESNQIHQLYNNLKDSIDNFNYVSLDTLAFGQGQYVSGSEAIYKLFSDFYCDCHINEEELAGNPKITELTSILEICDVILERLATSVISDKDVISTLTKHQFKYRIYPRLTLDVNNLKKHHCGACDKEHGLPDKMVQLIERLLNRTK